jgi:surfactin synthase thioesterase subunit
MSPVVTAVDRTWFRAYVPRPAARLRLFCFPHAGGTATAFRRLAELAPPSVEVVAVQYPGRQDRFGDPYAASLTAMAGDVATAIVPLLDRPAAFLGHSMGGTVAFETIRALRPGHPSAVLRLFVSARKAPHIDMSRVLRFSSDEEALEYVRALGGSGAQLLADPELRELVLPTLRDDFRLVEEYRFVPGAPLTCPVTVVVGDQDASCTTADAAQWARHTVGAHEVRALPGGHFYLEHAARELTDLLVRTLGADLPALRAATASSTPADREIHP